MRLARRVAEYYGNRDGMRNSKIALNLGSLTLGWALGAFVGRISVGDVHWWNVAGLVVTAVLFGGNLGFYISTRDLKRRNRR